MKVTAHLYNRALTWGKQVSTITKAQAYLAGSILDLERGRSVDINRQCWQCETSTGHSSWGYTEDLAPREKSGALRSWAMTAIWNSPRTIKASRSSCRSGGRAITPIR